MHRLLCANFARMKKTKIFWIGVLVPMIFGIWFLLGAYMQARGKYEAELPRIFPEIVFQSVVFGGIVFAAFCGLFTGTEYEDGTIRNKLMVGRSRASIYMTNFISSVAAAVVQTFVAVAAVLVLGMLLIGKPELELERFLKTCVVLLFVCVSYVSLWNLFTMLISKKSYAVTINILLAFLLLFAAAYLAARLCEPEMVQGYQFVDGVMEVGAMEPNPHYITGMQRSVYQFLLDFLPGGQTYQIANFSMQDALLRQPIKFCAYSACIAVVSNVVGVFLFSRKDIK
ncbi:MAG: ABC transporter permease [Eubacterium sp.]|nr:ABC transporter permease [Eubacterium sp.]